MVCSIPSSMSNATPRAATPTANGRLRRYNRRPTTIMVAIAAFIAIDAFGSCQTVPQSQSDYRPFGLSSTQLRGMLSMMPGLSPRCIERTVDGLEGCGGFLGAIEAKFGSGIGSVSHEDIQAFARSLPQEPECCNAIRRFDAGVCVCEPGLLTLYNRMRGISNVFIAFEAADCNMDNMYSPDNCAVQY